MHAVFLCNFYLAVYMHLKVIYTEINALFLKKKEKKQRRTSSETNTPYVIPVGVDLGHSYSLISPVVGHFSTTGVL